MNSADAKNILFSLPKKIIIVGYDDNGKKVIKGNYKNCNWTEQEAINKIPYYTNKYKRDNITGWEIKYMIDMTNSNYFCLDVDKKDLEYEDLLDKFVIFDFCCYSKGTTKGFHCFFEKKEGIKFNKKAIRINEEFEIDLICNNIIMSPNEELIGWFMNSYTIDDMKSVFTNKPFNECNVDFVGNEKINITCSGEQDINQMSELLNDKLDFDFGEWEFIESEARFKHGTNNCCVDKYRIHTDKDHSTLYFNKGRFLVANCHACGKKNIKLTHNESEDLRKYCGIENEDDKIKEEGLDSLAKTILLEDLLITRTDINDSYSLCEKIHECLFTELRYSNNSWYALNEDNLWRQIREPLSKIQKFVRKGLHNNRHKLQKELDNNDTNDNVNKLKNLIHCFKLTDSASFMGQVKKNLMSFLCDDTFVNKLDKNKYGIAYKNGIWDIKTNKFREGIYPEDYLTKTLDFDYIEGRNEADEDYIKSKFWGIANRNDEHYSFLMSVLGYALSGDSDKYQNFYSWIGQRAGNGKSTIFDILEQSFPQYVGNVDSKIIELDCKVFHKLIPQFAKLRICYMPEMNKNRKIDGKVFKILSEGKEIECDVMYGNTSKYSINAKAFLLSNHTLEFDNCDKGCERRLIHQQFNMEFRVEHEDNIETGQFKADLNLVSDIVSMRGSLMKMLMDYAHMVYVNGMPNCPQEFADEKAEMVNSNNDELDWLKCNLEKEDGAITSKKELVDAYISNTGKKAKPKDIMDYMKILGFHSLYEPQKQKRVNGKKEKGVYVGIKIIDDEE